MNETKLCSQESTTCQSELERVFTVLQRIENRLFEQTPQEGCNECANNKIIDLRNYIESVANRLQVIDEKLSFLG